MRFTELFICLFLILCFIYFISKSQAITIPYYEYSIYFNSLSQTIWNETFEGNENKTFWIKIPKYSTVLTARLSLNGYSSGYSWGDPWNYSIDVSSPSGFGRKSYGCSDCIGDCISTNVEYRGHDSPEVYIWYDVGLLSMQVLQI